MRIKLVNGNSLGYLKTLEDSSIESVVCDPPYGLSQLKQKEYLKIMGEWARGNFSYMPKKKGFMGQSWDGFVPPPSLWSEVLRILKPGGHALVFAGSRTQDLMGLSLRIAGFEIRDCIQWVYGSGFPKSYNIGKAVDKALGNEREVVGIKERGSVEEAIKKGVGYTADPANQNNKKVFGYGTETITKGSSDWEGWGTALKPAYEPILLVRKPLEGTVVQNTLEYGVGGINIDGCRVGDIVQDTSKNGRSSDVHKSSVYKSGLKDNVDGKITVGRFPSNFILSPRDGEDCPVDLLDKQSGISKSTGGRIGNKDMANFIYGGGKGNSYSKGESGFGDVGGASRFFYCAKASKSERESNQVGKDGKRFNIHPTVKPIKLMSYLVRLITPKGGKVLDPFMGSGTTGLACIEEGFDFLGVELNQDYFEIAKVRINEKASNR